MTAHRDVLIARVRRIEINAACSRVDKAHVRVTRAHIAVAESRRALTVNELAAALVDMDRAERALRELRR